MKIFKMISAASVFLVIAFLIPLSNGQTRKKPAADKTEKGKSSYISPDKGIGPIKEMKLGKIDPTMAEKGERLFKNQCVTCHMLDKKKLGPPLRSVTKDRPPEFIMNMILNTDQMEKKDPEVKKLIAQYQVYMTPLPLKQEQAKLLLEYLRSEGEKKPGN